jgi:hypothetical protein
MVEIMDEIPLMQTMPFNLKKNDEFYWMAILVVTMKLAFGLDGDLYVAQYRTLSDFTCSICDQEL